MLVPEVPQYMPASLDRRCYRIVLANSSMAVPWYLMACVAYEKFDEPIISDGMFDWLSRYMADHWDEIKHRHKHLIAMPEDRSRFKGSATTIVIDTLPGLVMGATEESIKLVRNAIGRIE